MARLVRIEGIEDPIGPGAKEKAVRVTSATDDAGLVKTTDIAESLAQLVVEQKMTNWLLAEALPYLELLKWLHPQRLNGDITAPIDIDQLRDELSRKT